MKYTLDSSMAIILDFTNDMPYSEFLRVVRLCNEEMIWIYAPVKNAFIITGLYPLRQTQKPEKKLVMIYL